MRATKALDNEAPRFPSFDRNSASAEGREGVDPSLSGNRGEAMGADRMAVALNVAASLLWLPQAALIAVAIGDVAGRTTTGAPWLAFAVLLIGILRASLDAAGGRIAFRAARKVLSQCRERASAAVAARSPLDVGRSASGRVGSVLAEQAEMIVPYLARYQTTRARVVIVPAVILLCIAPLSWVAALVLLLAAPLIPIFMALIGWRAKEASEAHLRELGGMNGFLLDRLRGLATIRALGAVDMTAGRLRDDVERLRERTMSVLRIAFLSSAVLELFAALGVAMVAVYIGFHLLGQLPFGAWGGTLSLSEGLFILLLAPAFFEPLRDLSAVWHDRAAGLAAFDELDRLTACGSDILGATSVARALPEAPVAAPSIRIEHLSFRHAGSNALVFERFDFSVAAGEHVAILGPSGSGKSTLLALVAGLAVPCSGSIAIGGHVLGVGNAADLRTGMAWVGQQPHIFAGTFFSNVALGRPGIGRTEIASALRFAKLDAIAEGRDAGSIGENGVGLSGGEALRLALARVAVGDGVKLILADEPTAHLDAITAKEIGDGLLVLAGGRTLIVATHDPVLAGRMDRIVRLESVHLRDAA
jgi:ATP-binding cassette subfamily C protein CydD